MAAETKKVSEPVNVRATQDGYYGTFRMPGDEFVIENEQAFSDKWMERIAKGAPPRKAESTE